MTWTTMLSDESVVELRPNGAELSVKFEDRLEYIKEVMRTRVQESRLQIRAIRKGLTTIIPSPFLDSKIRP